MDILNSLKHFPHQRKFHLRMVDDMQAWKMDTVNPQGRNDNRGSPLEQNFQLYMALDQWTYCCIDGLLDTLYKLLFPLYCTFHQDNFLELGLGLGTYNLLGSSYISFD